MKNFLLGLINFYQKWISRYTPASCRYQPTCSNYMKIAVERFGFFSGVIMGIARIIRCNPFVKGGLDPVPFRFSIFRNKIRK
ncbi:membrane protein insertion efficiency factor YidD [Fructilactobacillus vespulae]|uniref:membrane protein insertion efficiency factor YidD n=1 Tax=Fructilactobacillus vespulae TaxID=1249630 RepID=UPI0039B653A9